MAAVFLVLILAGATPLPSQDEATRLVEQLDSDDGAVRTKALQKLVDLGDSAEPALKKALEARSPEVAQRARSLLLRLEIRRTVSPTLVQNVPGLVDRLWNGGDPAWTRALLDLFDDQGWGEARILTLQASDLSPLIVRALKGAANDEETTKLLELAIDYALPEAGDFCARRVSDPRADYGQRVQAVRVLVQLRRKESLPALLGVLKDPEDILREEVLHACARLGWTEAVPAVREITRQPKEVIAGVAAQTLASLGALDAIPDIAKIVSSEAYGALGRLGDRAAIPFLMSAIAEGQGSETDEAVRAVTALAVRVPYEQLAPLLDDARPRVRSTAIRILAAMGEDQAARRFAELLSGDPAPAVRHEAFHALLAMDPGRIVPLLEPMARDKDALIRRDALKGRTLKDPEGVTSLILLFMEDPDPLVRIAAVDATASVPASKAREPLRRLLEDRDESVRNAAVFALAALEDGTVVPRLVDLLKHSQEPVRVRAVAALGAVGTGQALDRLRSLSKEPAHPLRTAALEALISRRGKELLEQVESCLEDRDPALQSFALRQLATWGEFGSAPKVGTLLRETRERQVLSGAIDYLVRQGTEDALLQIADVVFELPGDLWPGVLEMLCYSGNRKVAENILQKVQKGKVIGPSVAEATAIVGLPEAVPVWRAVLKSESSNSREAALHALAKLGGPGLVPELQPYLSSRSARVRAAALRAVAALRGDAGGSAAETLIRDRNSYVRAAAAEVLGESAAKSPIPLLVAALKDPDPDVRRAAARALARKGRTEGVEVMLREAPPEGENLTELNALRAPASWSRLETGRVKKTLWGEKHAVRRTMQEECGLKQLDLGRGGRDRDAVQIGVPSYGGRMPLFKAWESILSAEEDLVLDDPDGARIVGRWQAARFWNLWWEQERARKK